MMAKEWILNSATNRFQLNHKRNVGATSESIRNCSPENIEEWQDYYFENVRSQEHIENLGKKLYANIINVLIPEIKQITEEDCIKYLKNLVIARTYDGYVREINTIYKKLQKSIEEKIEPAPDEWDRIYNVDYFIKINDKYIGLQIKPVSSVAMIPEIYKEQEIQHKSHVIFTNKFGGKVFYLFSGKNDQNDKIIINSEVIDQIKDEIIRLKNIKS